MEEKKELLDQDERVVEIELERLRGFVNHPQNCSHECPYGHDKSFCFPCYKKLVEDMRKKKETGNGI